MAIPVLLPPPRTGQGRPSNMVGYTFADWVKERSTKSPDQIFDIEAKSQGLVKDKKPAQTKAKKTKTITTPLPQRLKYPDDWLDAFPGGINLTGPGSQTIVPSKPGSFGFTDSIMFTVNGATTITLYAGGIAVTGPMAFGAEGQPMGVAHTFGGEGLPLRAGELQIYSTGAGVNVSGICNFHYKELKPKQ